MVSTADVQTSRAVAVLVPGMSNELDDVPGLGAGYGWAAATQKPSSRLADVAPDGGYANSP